MLHLDIVLRVFIILLEMIMWTYFQVNVVRQWYSAYQCSVSSQYTAALPAYVVIYTMNVRHVMGVHASTICIETNTRQTDM